MWCNLLLAKCINVVLGPCPRVRWRANPWSHRISILAQPRAIRRLSWLYGSLGHFMGFWTTFSSAVYSFSGVESISIAASETQSPRQNIPKAAKRIFWRVVIFYGMWSLLLYAHLATDLISVVYFFCRIARPLERSRFTHIYRHSGTVAFCDCHHQNWHQGASIDSQCRCAY